MAYDYGYGDLENQLIDLFCSGTPDFHAAEALIQQGADLNAIGKDDDENILSEILGYGCWSESGDSVSDICINCNDNHCDYCEHDPNLSQTICKVICFFLEHGFDVTKRNGCFGAQCLWALTLSTFDRYMIDATKILLDAGAKNRTTSPDSGETPWNFIGEEQSFQDTCECNHALANIYEAVYQIYQAIEDGRSYSGIDSYQIAVGKKILKVLAQSNGDTPVFYPIDLPEFRKDNCYTKNLYFVYDGGVLITTQYADFWTDTVLPDAKLVDVSEHFEGIVGSTIERFILKPN